MSDAADGSSKARIGARLWRSFITTAYLFGMLAWTVADSRPQPMSLSMCFYGRRCPAVPVAAHARIHPTLADVMLLGVAALLVAWAVPFLFEDCE